MRYLLVNSASRKVINAIEIDEAVQADQELAFTPPAGCVLIASDEHSIGAVLEEELLLG